MANNPDMRAQFPVALNISISKEMDALIGREVKRRGVSKSLIVRELMDAGLEARLKQAQPLVVRGVGGIPL